VLEVGPGGYPHPRSDVLLEKVFHDEKEAKAQRGYADKLKTTQKMVYYNGGKFPFKDQEFDYVICSHVLEHVPREEIPAFISELQRVAKAGFIEYPTIFYELINYQDVHLWLMNFRDDTILFLDKNSFKAATGSGICSRTSVHNTASNDASLTGMARMSETMSTLLVSQVPVWIARPSPEPSYRQKSWLT